MFAPESFMRNHFEIGEKLKKLQEYHDNHFEVDPEKLNWGDVGSAAEINRLLSQVLIFAGLEEEK